MDILSLPLGDAAFLLAKITFIWFWFLIMFSVTVNMIIRIITNSEPYIRYWKIKGIRPTITRIK